MILATGIKLFLKLKNAAGVSWYPNARSRSCLFIGSACLTFRLAHCGCWLSTLGSIGWGGWPVKKFLLLFSLKIVEKIGKSRCLPMFSLSEKGLILVTNILVMPWQGIIWRSL